MTCLFLFDYFCQMKLVVNSLSQIDATAQKIIVFAGTQKIFLFYGDMGAGKTTLIKALCKNLGTHDNIASPTFSIVNEYKTETAGIYHFDLYRLKNQNEALDMGFEEYLYSGNYCFVEWPERIPDLLPLHYISIKITVTGNDTRLLNIVYI